MPRALFKTIYNMKIHVWLLLGLVLIWGIQCDNKKPVGPADEGAISINIEVPQAGGRSVQTPAKATVSQGRLRIGTAPVVHKDTLLQVQGGRLRATIQGIPVGQQTVGLSLLDAAGD